MWWLQFPLCLLVSGSLLGLITTGNISETSSHLIESFSFLNFYQLNIFLNSHGSLLDLIFSNGSYPSTSIAFSPIVSPDPYHSFLSIRYPFHDYFNSQISHWYNDLKSGDYNSMANFVKSFNWEKKYSHSTQFMM